jgi:hypothetical protein
VVYPGSASATAWTSEDFPTRWLPENAIRTMRVYAHADGTTPRLEPDGPGALAGTCR